MKKLLVVLLVAIPLLTACGFLAGSAVGSAVSTSVINERRCINTVTEDHSIHYQAALKFKSDPSLKHTHLIVSAFNHFALLAGEVQSSYQRQQAEALLRSISEVKRIYNAVTIGPVISPKMRSKDAWITAKVRSAMLADFSLNSTQIKVTTEDATVYLMGVVTERQASTVTDIAKQIRGVKRVVKLFEYDA